MDLVNVLKYVIAIAAAGLVITVLMQARSGGLGVTFGGSGGGEAYRSKRGLEALVFNLTIVFVVVFALASLALAVLSV